MEKPCEICGDSGFDVAIIICHVCKSSREHAYCMVNYKGDVPQVWTCEECENGKTNSDVAASHGRSKWVKKPKTKYLSELEAILLSSGTTSNLPRDKLAPTTTRTPLKANRHNLDAQKFSPSKSKSYHVTGSSSYLRFEPQTSQASKCQVLASKEAKRQAQKSLQLRGFVHPQKNANIGKCVEDIETANREVQEDQEEFGEDDSVAEKRILTTISSQILPSDPALHPSWKGTFRLTSSTLTAKLQHEIQVHPRHRVPRKVYEFSKKMPQVLEFQLLPRDRIWSDLYPSNVHDNDKIGLYVFPTDSNSNEKFIELLHLISGGDFVMRCNINGIELLVFASGCLPEDSRRWNGDEFLWGVFRRVKEADHVTVKAAPIPPFSSSFDESEDVDMEIDMIGGTQVGKVDVIIPRRQTPDALSPAVSRTGSSAGNHELYNLTPPPPPPGFENSKFALFRSPSQKSNPEVMGLNSAVHVKVKTEVL